MRSFEIVKGTRKGFPVFWLYLMDDKDVKRESWHLERIAASHIGKAWLNGWKPK